MVAYLVRRLLIGIPVLLGVTMINFLIINLAPGSPADLFLSPTATLEDVARTKAELGLDRPIFVQYLNWLTQLLHGNLGVSFQNREPVTQLIADRLSHLVLPVVVLATAIAANMVRYVRSSMIDAFGQDYIRTAKAKGLGPSVITNKHALRNALIPVVTVIGIDLSALIGGAIVTEQIFQWPGIGLLTIQSIGARDYAVLMGINLIAAVAVFAANLLTDIAYAVVDPRVAYA
jgi:ABC-type dipeptide/oligopeptide/nickel transport system permease component